MTEMMERLEERRLCAVTLAGGTLTLTGNAKNNNWQITYVTTPVLGTKKVLVGEATLGGQPVVREYSQSAVKKIKVVGGGGDDIAVFAGSKKTPIFFDGGTGNDTCSAVASTGKCTMLGGAGNDVLTSGSGADSLDGGAGNDTLSSGAGNDVLTGGAGRDSFNAGDGNDTLYARDGELDEVRAGSGADRVRADLFAGTQNANETAFSEIETLF